MSTARQATVANSHTEAAGELARLASQAEDIARRSLDAVRGSAATARERANEMGQATVRYVKDEPVKSILFAAAAGAALMGIVSLVRSARRANDAT